MFITKFTITQFHRLTGFQTVILIQLFEYE